MENVIDVVIIVMVVVLLLPPVMALVRMILVPRLAHCSCW